MNTIINVSETQLELGLLRRIEASLRSVLQDAIHSELEKSSKRHISNGVWEPLPGSLSSKMWLIFNNENLSRDFVDFKKLTIISISNGWEYKSVFREFERWRAYNNN